MKRPRRLERTWCFSLVTFSSAPLAYPTTAHSRERTETKSSTTGSRRQRKEKFPSVNRLVCRARCLSPITTREWAVFGLPTDAVSTDNGVLVTRGKRWPLMT
mmetsp:Transcript_2441/g.5383  ORF Transcript_2441/g.5383 Transcript_2441/m.5383 type:complete len:102 (-) Transcript_2441:150-455(-)